MEGKTGYMFPSAAINIDIPTQQHHKYLAGSNEVGDYTLHDSNELLNKHFQKLLIFSAFIFIYSRHVM